MKDKPERQVLLSVLGFILFIGFMAEKTYETTFQWTALIFGIVALGLIWQKIEEKATESGLRGMVRWVAPWIFVGVSSVAILAGFIWYMSKPTLVNVGGTVSFMALGLLGLVLIGSFVLAIGSIIFDKLRKLRSK